MLAVDNAQVTLIFLIPKLYFFDKNQNTLKFFKDGDVVVVNNKGKGVTAFGASDMDGMAKPMESLTSGKYEGRVFQIE